ncbi:MAG: T9SS type A sorting domain-containing protein [Salinivirgaceae bacterium]|nr:T9SS type A sorting domain-containing protein [Salinivirgaceae bacterium]
MKTRILFLAMLYLTVFSFNVRAQTAGDIDLTFNPSDIGFGSGGGLNNSVMTTAIQSDGKIIIGGGFYTYNGTERNRIVRLNTNGTLDTTFTTGTGTNHIVFTIAIQSDGKIIIGGYFTTFNGTTINHIARLNADGTLDATFNPGFGANECVRTTAIQSDGKIIIGGDFTSYNGTTINHIARLNADGTLDPTFNPGTGANNEVNSIAILSDGKIIIGGKFYSYNGTTKGKIARLNTDGTLDANFNQGSGANNDVNSIAIQNDGKIIIGGDFTSYNGTAINRIARLNMDGTLDATFNVGFGANNDVYSIAVQSDEKIIIGGYFTSYNGTTRNPIARLNADGTLDATFDTGTGADKLVESIAIQSDGKIIIGGNFDSFNGTVTICLARLNADGTLDATFNPQTGANYSINTTAIQSDGGIIIGGAFTSYNGIVINRIARLNADGTLDATFITGTGADNIIYTTAIQSDGKIIIGGDFTSYNGTARNHIARLNADGTLDATFNPGFGANGIVYTTAIQSDGKIIIGGYFSSYNGTTMNGIARLNADGTLDTSFNQGSGANYPVKSIAIQSDGKIIIGGDFTSYNGTDINRIARLNTDGTLDSTFAPGTGASYIINTTTIQSDGKIIIGGQFTYFNGIARNYIARLKTDGSIDATFSPGTGADSYVKTIAIQSDGKIIIGGELTSFNGKPINHFARLNSEGTLDTTFNHVTGADNFVNTTAIQSDGKIIIGGNFTSYNSTGRNRVARVLGCIPLTTTDTITGLATVCQGQKAVTYTIPANANASSYIWTLPTGATGTSTTNSISVDFGISATSGDVTVKGINTCGEGSTSTFAVTVNSKPTTPIISLDENVLHSDAPLGNQWFDQNSLISDAIEQDYTASVNGDYYAIVTLLGCSSDASNTINVTLTGIEVSENNTTIKAYPNPVSDKLIIEIEGNSEKLKFAILNINGQVAFKGNLVEKTIIQTSDFAPGVYIIKLENGKSFEFKKIIKK